MPLEVPRFIVVGGGAAGAFYVRQLLRAVQAGRLRTQRLHVVDRDAGCAVAACTDPRVRLEVAEWGAWLDARLGDFDPADHLVPYHWAPHLLRDWLERALTAKGASVRRQPAVPAFQLPFERPLRDGARALSFATWTCPPTCIEPALCPHTRGVRDWSLVRVLESPRDDEPPFEPLVFASLHLTHGVASLPLRQLLDARARLLAASGTKRYLVATASHCHGLASVLEVARRPG